MTKRSPTQVIAFCNLVPFKSSLLLLVPFTLNMILFPFLLILPFILLHSHPHAIKHAQNIFKFIDSIAIYIPSKDSYVRSKKINRIL